MPFRFRKASCIVVGTFNIYILHPQWLARREIIEPGTEVGIETNFARPGFRFQFPKHHVVWNVAPDRVAVESTAQAADCGNVVAKVLRALPETPLFGLGNNTVYEANHEDLAGLLPAIRDFPRPRRAHDEECVSQQTFHFGVKRGTHRVVNLQLSIHEGGIELVCNVHQQLHDRADATQAAIAAAEEFFQDRKVSERLAGQFFGVTIDHDAHYS